MKTYSLKQFQNISICLSKVKTSNKIFLAKKNENIFLTEEEKSFLKSIKFFDTDLNFYIFREKRKSNLKVVIFNNDLCSKKIGDIISKLPSGNYCLDTETFKNISEDVIHSFILSSYHFSFFKKRSKRRVFLNFPEKKFERAILLAKAEYLARNMINMPANFFNTQQLADICKDFEKMPSVSVSEIVSARLLKKNFPLVHAVGRSSTNKPRFIEIKWKNKLKFPEIVLVGKGVCFDSGGLNLKTNSSILLMKKDMGGSANALALAYLIIKLKLKFNLRVLIPIVENSISDNSFRPGDILKSRKGLTIEVTNTDAEGRLILADALAYADENFPEMVISLATLTGAARVAVGTEIAPFFSTNNEISKKLVELGEKHNDYVWPLPFFDGYNKQLKSPIADLINAPYSPPTAGAITAGLFLKKFVDNAKEFLHFDIYAWQNSSEPGKTKGGKMQAVRALIEFLESYQK